MSDDNQIIIPPSFISMFVEPGRIKPSASREHIHERYDLCEDLANLLTEQASNKLWELGITESDVLQRISTGLAETDIGLSDAEAGWVIKRLAEILGWQQ
ncbi:hypothetical protein BCM14_1247 [Jezberella montanilacus]|jgi:hypothetical protein|uniref:ATPase with chaperone activity n=1 Tax=Jezberella montanilacus TaxID=323426 RepID=A0A2T0XHI9_9BURK|nr:ATPase with chaperone activity [Jezberella montanilacus]PRY98419.1 hypothetical protein BCM14_1247 [Jezberella montanilacus]